MPSRGCPGSPPSPGWVLHLPWPWCWRPLACAAVVRGAVHFVSLWIRRPRHRSRVSTYTPSLFLVLRANMPRSGSQVDSLVAQTGSPPTFYRFAAACGRGRLRWRLHCSGAIALYGGLVLAPADYQQGDAYRIIFIHVPSAWMSLFIYGVMGLPRLSRWSGDQAGGGGGDGIGADRRCVHLHHPGHRLAVGQADVGHLVDVGRAAHLRAGAAVPVSRRDRSVSRVRGSPPGCARRGVSRADRHHQRADRAFFGELVEHPASGFDHPFARPSTIASWACCGRC
jgi:hypothetical protein